MEWGMGRAGGSKGTKREREDREREKEKRKVKEKVRRVLLKEP